MGYSIRVSLETYTALVARRDQLSQQLGTSVSIDDAIKLNVINVPVIVVNNEKKKGNNPLGF